MELRPWITVLFALAVVVAHSHALLMTVHNTECVWEDVEFDGDVVSGNFVVLDQEVFWGSEHPGIELIVCTLTSLALFSLLSFLLFQFVLMYPLWFVLFCLFLFFYFLFFLIVNRCFSFFSFLFLVVLGV